MYTRPPGAAPPSARVLRRGGRPFTLRSDGVVTRDELEAAIWQLTRWTGSPGPVEALLTMVDAYAAGKAVTAMAPPASSPLVAGASGDKVGDHGEPIAPLPEPVPTSPAFPTTSSLPSKVTPLTIGLDGKMCPGCKRELTMDSFGMDRSRKDDHRRRCRDCERESRNSRAMANAIAALSEPDSTRSRPGR